MSVPEPSIAADRRPHLAIFLLASLAFAFLAAFTWIDPPNLWVLGLANAAWVISVSAGFLMLGRRGAWTLLTSLIVLPVALFYGGLWFSCVVNSACL